MSTPPELTLYVTCMACPTQMEGKIGTVKWDFRSRHGHWVLSIDNANHDKFSGNEDLDIRQALNKVMAILEPYIVQTYVAADDARYRAAQEEFYGTWAPN